MTSGRRRRAPIVVLVPWGGSASQQVVECEPLRCPWRSITIMLLCMEPPDRSSELDDYETLVSGSIGAACKWYWALVRA